jgi:hypothetical protein
MLFPNQMDPWNVCSIEEFMQEFEQESFTEFQVLELQDPLHPLEDKPNSKQLLVVFYH